MASPLLEAFQWGAGGAKLTPEEVARQREIASALMQRGNPAFHNAGWLGAIGRGLEGAYAGWSESRANEAESAGRAAYNERLSALFDGAPMASTPPQLGGSPATSTAMATMPAPNSGDLRGGIISTATALGIAPEDLATAISYETAGTFDPTKRGPTTQWGQHRGLIQFGEPQAKQYGVNWDDPLGSQLGPDGAIAKYLRDTGVKPGMGLLDIYSAINAGGVGRYNRSDANNGGAPGTVRDKVEKQMAGHRQKALALLGMNGQTQAPAVAALDALAGGKAAPPSITDAEAKEILSRPRPADAQPYSGPGSIIDPAGVAQLEQTRLEQERAARYAAMPGWMQEMIPQSVAPLSDDQFAARFATTGGPAPEMRDGAQMPGAQEYVADRMAGMAPSLPEPRMVDVLPVADIARSLTGATLADDRVPMAGGASSFAPVGTQAPNVSLPAGAQFTLPEPQQQVAQSLAQGGGQPSMQQLIELASDPWATPAQRQVVGALLQQQMDAADPMRQAQLEKLRLEMDQLRSGAPSANSSFGNLDAQARAAGLVPGTPQYQDFMLNGGGAPATFRALDMQAQAAGFTPGTPEYNEFMATRGAGLQAGAAQTARNIADIDTGGAAAGAKVGGQKTMEAGFDAWKDYGKLQTSIGNMDEAIAALDGGAKSGVIYKMLPNITEASASLQNAMDRMGLDVIGSVTFGALSEGEMRLAMQTAAPRDLPPAELRNWLVKKRDAQIKAADMLADAAQFLTKPGNTINDWIERNRSAKKAQGTSGQSSTGIQWSIED